MTVISKARFGIVLLSLMAVTCSDDGNKVAIRNPPTVSDLTIRIKKRSAQGTPREILHYLGLLTTEDRAFFDEAKTGGGGGATGHYKTYVLDNIAQGLRLHFEYELIDFPTHLLTKHDDCIYLVNMIELYMVDKNGVPETEPIVQKILENPIAGG